MIRLTELQNKMQLQQKISEVRKKGVAREESAKISGQGLFLLPCQRSRGQSMCSIYLAAG